MAVNKLKVWVVGRGIPSPENKMLGSFELEQAQALARQQVRRRPDGTEYNLPCRMINCFCMYSDYTPLTLDEWIMNDKIRSLYAL